MLPVWCFPSIKSFWGHFLAILFSEKNISKVLMLTENVTGNISKTYTHFWKAQTLLYYLPKDIRSCTHLCGHPTQFSQLVVVLCLVIIKNFRRDCKWMTFKVHSKYINKTINGKLVCEWTQMKTLLWQMLEDELDSFSYIQNCLSCTSKWAKLEFVGKFST